MATIRAYTTIEQSRKLAEILPLESADMSWVSCDFGRQKYYQAENRKRIPAYEKNHWLPCWSLAALLDAIPQEIFDGEYIINITEGCANRWVLTYDHYENRNHSYYSLSIGADNLVDACVAMIEKLHELKICDYED